MVDGVQYGARRQGPRPLDGHVPATSSGRRALDLVSLLLIAAGSAVADIALAVLFQPAAGVLAVGLELVTVGAVIGFGRDQ